jgi:hypothetical protein
METWHIECASATQLMLACGMEGVGGSGLSDWIGGVPCEDGTRAVLAEGGRGIETGVSTRGKGVTLAEPGGSC